MSRNGIYIYRKVSYIYVASYTIGFSIAIVLINPPFQPLFFIYLHRGFVHVYTTLSHLRSNSIPCLLLHLHISIPHLFPFIYQFSTSTDNNMEKKIILEHTQHQTLAESNDRFILKHLNITSIS